MGDFEVAVVGVFAFFFDDGGDEKGGGGGWDLYKVDEGDARAGDADTMATISTGVGDDAIHEAEVDGFDKLGGE